MYIMNYTNIATENMDKCTFLESEKFIFQDKPSEAGLLIDLTRSFSQSSETTLLSK